MIDEGLLDDYRAERAALVEGGLENEMYYTWFHLGYALLWHGDLSAAQAELENALVMCRRAGDKLAELRALTYLACSHLRQHHVADVEGSAPRVEELAGALSFPEYAGMAKAMMSWVAWKKGRPADVEPLAQEALAHWGSCVVHYNFCWVCLWPLVAVRLASGQVAEAVEAGRQLLVPPQQRLPEELESSVQAAVAAWDEGRAQLAEQKLGAAVELAQRLRYA